MRYFLTEIKVGSPGYSNFASQAVGNVGLFVAQSIKTIYSKIKPSHDIQVSHDRCPDTGKITVNVVETTAKKLSLKDLADIVNDISKNLPNHQAGLEPFLDHKAIVRIKPKNPFLA